MLRAPSAGSASATNQASLVPAQLDDAVAAAHDEVVGVLLGVVIETRSRHETASTIAPLVEIPRHRASLSERLNGAVIR
jgi:hypothetical protein